MSLHSHASSIRWCVAIVALLVPLVQAVAEPKKFDTLSVRGKHIVDEAGQPVTLRGVNLGNWLVLEMWMLAWGEQPGVGDQHELDALLAKRFGDAGRHELMELYRAHYMTDRDFALIPTFNMNVVRLPFEYRLLMDDDRPMQLRAEAFKWLDHAVDSAERHGLYVILDLHGAPGRQSAMDHTGRKDHNRLWSDEAAQARTIWLWQRLAERYRDRPSVMAYDVLNEPWGGTREQLASLVGRIYDGVRAVDAEKIVVIPGFYDGIDFYGRPQDHGWANVIFTMHFYPGFFGNGAPKPWTHADFIRGGLTGWKQRMDRLDTPLFIGEFNVVLNDAGGAEMMRRYYDLYADNGWPATMWSYKVFSANGGIGAGSWGMVTNRDALPTLELATAPKNEIEAWFRGLSTMELAPHEELRHWLTTSESPAPLDTLPQGPPKLRAPPAVDALPEGWSAADVGDALAGGQRVESPDHFTLYGAGDDIWQTSDSFRFVYRELPADGSITARVTRLDDTHTYAKAGLMIRAGLDPGAPHALLNLFPSGDVQFATRPTRDGDTTASNAGRIDVGAAFIRLTRRGDTVEAAYRRDGQAWVPVGTANLPNARGPLFAGLAVLSHDNSQLTTATFAEVEVRGAR